MVAPSLRSRNFIYGGGLFLLVAGFAGVPLLISHRRSVEGTSPLTTQGKPLVGHQLMRGAYNNHGSKDVGLTLTGMAQPKCGKETERVDLTLLQRTFYFIENNWR